MFHISMMQYWYTLIVLRMMGWIILPTLGISIEYLRILLILGFSLDNSDIQLGYEFHLKTRCV